MKITTITFMQTFPTGNYSNQKLAVEVTLEEEDFSVSTPDSNIIRDAFSYAKGIVNDAFKEMNPEIGQPGLEIPPWQNPIVNVTQVDSRETEVEKLLKTISECPTIKNLEIFANTVQRLSEPVLFEAYQKKKIELQHEDFRNI